MDSSSNKESSSKSATPLYGITQNRSLVRKLFEKCNALREISVVQICTPYQE
jgi:hypothetical protein